MKQKRNLVMTRLIQRNSDLDEFDFIFWKQAGIAKKFEAAWQMVLDLPKWKGKNAGQPRLRRSIAVLKPREG